MKVFENHSFLPGKIVKAKDCILWDENGTEYLDLYGNHAEISIGYNHPHFVKAMEEVDKISSDSLKNQIQGKLGRLSNYENYILSYGASSNKANEKALEIAISHTGNKNIIAFKGSTYAVRNVSYLQLDLDEVKRIMSETEVAAVIYEPIQSDEILLPTDEFVKGLREVCTETGVILIADETRSGWGRSGKFFAHQHSEIQADLITMSHGMGNGYPVGGVFISPEFINKDEVFDTECDGDKLPYAATLAVLEVIEKEELIKNADEIGFYISRALNRFPKINDIRGRGLMMGIEFDFPVAEMKKNLLEKHRIGVGCANGNIIQLFPPLTVKKAYIDKFLNALEEEILK